MITPPNTPATSAICIGKPIIQILAKEGMWVGSIDGHGVVAADELFRNDPYEKIEALTIERDSLKAERDEADRRAGAAERLLANERDTNYRRTGWLDKAKQEWGCDRNTSFDVIWNECLHLKAKETNGQ